MITYSYKLAQSICADIAAGDSVAKAARNHQISERVVYKWLSIHQEFVQQYMRAREARADARFESSAKVIQKLVNKKIDPATARVMLDEIKWKCGQEHPARYGEKRTLDVTITDATLDDPKKVLERLEAIYQRALENPSVTDAEYVELPDDGSDLC